MSKNIVILGGGVGGLVTARRLAGRLRGKHRIILVDRRDRHLFSPTFLWVMMGWRRPEEAGRSLAGLARYGVEFMQAQVEGIDLAERAVRTSAGKVPFDHLVVSLGADVVPEALPGLAEIAHTPYTLAGAEKLRGELAGFRRGRVVVMVSSVPFKCPAAPYETALLLEAFFRERGVRGKVEMEIVTPEPQPMPVAGPVLGGAVKGILSSKGIAYRPNTPVSSVDAVGKSIVLKDGGSVGFDLLVAVPPHRPPAVLRESGLAGETGWVPVDRFTLETKQEGIFAIGDNTTITLSNGKPLPKAGVFAHAEAEVVAESIAARLEGRPAPDRFGGKGYCWVEMGEGRAGFAGGNFYAEPDPVVRLYRPGRLWRMGKVLFEKWWMWKWI